MRYVASIFTTSLTNDSFDEIAATLSETEILVVRTKLVPASEAIESDTRICYIDYFSLAYLDISNPDMHIIGQADIRSVQLLFKILASLENAKIYPSILLFPSPDWKGLLDWLHEDDKRIYGVPEVLNDVIQISNSPEDIISATLQDRKTKQT